MRTKLTNDYTEQEARLERLLDETWHTTTRAGKYRISTLQEAFNKVAPRDNWKNPIRTACRTEDKDKVAEAITFYTGSVAEFEDLSNGWTAVKAEGYYAAIGA